MMKANLLLLVIPEVKNNEGILTGKLFEYLAAKRPILLIGPENGDAAKIIRETESGFICNYNDCERITDVITDLFNNRATEWKNFNSLKYSRKNLTMKLLDVILDTKTEDDESQNLMKK